MSTRHNDRMDPSAFLRLLGPEGVRLEPQADPGRGGDHRNGVIDGGHKNPKYSAKATRAALDGGKALIAPAPGRANLRAPVADDDVSVSGSIGDGGEEAKKSEMVPIKQSALEKQAALLAQRFPDSQILQRMLLQVQNPKVLEADKRGILALMNSEVQMLAEEAELNAEAV
jgi:hypothetical protein